MVYVITDGSGYVKIGATNQLKQRLITIQTGNPRPITVLFTFETDTLREDRMLEKALHNEFVQFRLSFDNGFISEWFDDKVLDRLSVSDDFIEYICDKYGFLRITAHTGISYADVEVRRSEKLKTVMYSLNIYGSQEQEEQDVVQTKEEAKTIPMFKPCDVVTTKKTLDIGKTYSGFSYANGMSVWRAVVCSVHEWKYGFYYMLDNEICYSEEMLEVYQPWKKPLSSKSA